MFAHRYDAGCPVRIVLNHRPVARMWLCPDFDNSIGAAQPLPLLFGAQNVGQLMMQTRAVVTDKIRQLCRNNLWANEQPGRDTYRSEHHGAILARETRYVTVA